MVAPDGMQPGEYYLNPEVQARMREYLGADERETPTAHFVVGFDPYARTSPTWAAQPHVPSAQLPALWAQGWDVCRSLWDARALIFALDLDYQNLDYPGEPFTHASDVFFKLENSYVATRRVLDRLGLPAIAVSTGRGYHFTGRVPLDHPVVDRIAAGSAVPAWHATHAVRKPPFTPLMSAREARAATGLGLLLEYLAHLIVAEAARTNLIPLVFNGTTVGSGEVGRECVSIDFSHAGDPLDDRHIRAAFSTYQWHRSRPDIFGGAVAALPSLAAVPRFTTSLEEFLLAGRHLTAACRIAGSCRAALPDVAEGVDALASVYATSPLADIHRAFEDERHARMDEPVRELPTDLPPCVAFSLEHPNDLLLKPEHVQNLVRLLLARHWSAAEIAALVQRAYEADHHWGTRWSRMDPRTRADFDVRVFAGLAMSGLDRAVDFNCSSSQDKGICPRTSCTHDLRIDRDRLLARFARRDAQGAP